MSEDRKLLEPLATVVSIVLRLLMAALAMRVVLSIVRGNWDNGFVCIVDESTDIGALDDIADLFVEKGAAVDAVPRYCATAPDASLRLLHELGTLPTTLLLISSLFLLHQLLRGAARDGVHTARTAARLRLLGWWLLAGSLLAEFIEANADAAVLAALALEADLTVGAWLSMWSTPYLALLVGLGLLTFARITRVGTSMREDLEGVV